MGIVLVTGAIPYYFTGRMGFTSSRELTRAELRDIRRLAADMCANYDKDYGCLLLDGRCYMHYGIAYTNSGLCKYFHNAMLPLNPRLEAVFNGENIAEHIRQCNLCGKELYIDGGKRKYCEPCARRVHRRQKTECERKRRLGVDK